MTRSGLLLRGKGGADAAFRLLVIRYSFFVRRSVFLHFTLFVSQRDDLLRDFT